MYKLVVIDNDGEVFMTCVKELTIANYSVTCSEGKFEFDDCKSIIIDHDCIWNERDKFIRY